jgi:hypothetical protein
VGTLINELCRAAAQASAVLAAGAMPAGSYESCRLLLLWPLLYFIAAAGAVSKDRCCFGGCCCYATDVLIIRAATVRINAPFLMHLFTSCLFLCI